MATGIIQIRIIAKSEEKLKRSTQEATNWNMVTTAEGSVTHRNSLTTRISSSRRFTTSALWNLSFPFHALRIALLKASF